MAVAEEELARRRALMGDGIAAWVNDPTMYLDVVDGAWALISGAPTPDLNMVLAYKDNALLLDAPLAEVTTRSCPSLVMLAGPGKALASRLPDRYAAVGTMPVMEISITDAPRGPDARVRRADDEDAARVARLIAEAFGFDVEIAQLVTAPLEHGELSSGTAMWLLEDGGDAVSTVTSCRTADVVSLWCMATSPKFARRGYGRALLGAVLDWAHDDGATLGLLGATPAGYPLYEATGWRVAEEWALYTDATSEQFTT